MLFLGYHWLNYPGVSQSSGTLTFSKEMFNWSQTQQEIFNCYPFFSDQDMKFQWRTLTCSRHLKANIHKLTLLLTLQSTSQSRWVACYGPHGRSWRLCGVLFLASCSERMSIGYNGTSLIHHDIRICVEQYACMQRMSMKDTFLLYFYYYSLQYVKFETILLSPGRMRSIKIPRFARINVVVS